MSLKPANALKEKHCAENIKEKYEQCIPTYMYDNADKISHIVRDNAANMNIAFDLSLSEYVDAYINEETL